MMIDICDKDYKPNISEISEYIGNPLFSVMFERLSTEYKAKTEIAYSGEKAFLGWNVKFAKGSRTLIRAYPRDGFFYVLVVVGKKEKERVEAMLDSMSDVARSIYEKAGDFMGQRWLMMQLTADDELFRDCMSIVDIRAKSK